MTRDQKEAVEELRRAVNNKVVSAFNGNEITLRHETAKEVLGLIDDRANDREEDETS